MQQMMASTRRGNTVQYSTVQYRTHYSTLQYRIQYSTVPDAADDGEHQEGEHYDPDQDGDDHVQRVG